MIKNILLAVVIGITLAGSAVAEDAPTTLLSSGTISPYQAQRNGLFMAADFLAAVPGNTRFELSTQPWIVLKETAIHNRNVWNDVKLTKEDQL